MGSKAVYLKTICAVIILLVIVGCGGVQVTPVATPLQAESTPTTAPDLSSEIPAYWPTAGWRTSTPEEQGMDSELLSKMFDHLIEQKMDIHSVTVVRNGYLVADAVIYPFVPESKHIIHSVTKSIVSALTGIAIEQGYIDSVNQPVLSLFPQRTAANLDENKEAMTLEHLLMMASGLECRDSYLYRWRGMNQMRQTDDWAQFILDLPMAEEPGSRFEYCNGASFLLSAIIQETSGMSALAFAETHLFGPLGIRDVAWPANHQGISIGWGEIRMRPHDMAKIGYLYLNDGVWEGELIIPADWVAVSTRKQIDATLQDGYGYQWWVEDGYYLALGYAGQFIYVVPDQELVVVFTSNLEDDDFYDPKNLLEIFIIPSVVSSTPLPANPNGAARLQILINEAGEQREVTAQHVPPPPAIAEQVLGETYTLEQNVLSWRSLSLVKQEGSEALLRLTFDDTASYPKSEYQIGLDGVQRSSTDAFGTHTAAKGSWEGENTFIAEADEPGNLLNYRLELNFSDDDLTATLTGNFPDTYVLQGKRARSQ